MSHREEQHARMPHQPAHGKAAAPLLCLLVLAVLFNNPAAAQASDQSLIGPELEWLRENFSGPFTWSITDPATGEEITGRGDCEMVYGGLFLRCVHFSPTGEEMGVGISGFHKDNQKYQWTYYGADSSAMLHGEGHRDAAAETSYMEGKQKLPGLPEFTFRTVTKKLSDGVWSYTHYRLDADTPVEMFHATFTYKPYKQ